MPGAPVHDARLDRIRLRVRDVEEMAAFYARVLGMEGAGPDAEALAFPPPRAPAGFLLLLDADPDTVIAPAHAPGLYHFALLYPDRPALARAVRRVLDAGWERIDGASDHGVSEAFYIRDPEGNGVELYRDRPRDRWPERDGEVGMTTDPLDLNDLLAVADDPGEPGPPRLGHVHLHVADLERSRDFYVDVVGLRIRQSSYPGALFLADGDYHHHLGLNVWARGRSRPPDATGLLDYGWRMPRPRIRAIRDRAESADLEVRARDDGLILRDPDGIRVIVRPGEDARGSSAGAPSGTSPGSAPGKGDGAGGAPSP